MNINDIEKVDKVPENILKAIFEKQHELALKYQPIEAKSGLLQTTDFPVDLQDPAGQARLKDLAWRTIEELGEAGEAEEFAEMAAQGGEDWTVHIEHFKEEIIDSLHFFVELLLSSGMKWDDFPAWSTSVDSCQGNFSQSLSDFTVNLGVSMNFLKNKPWKQTHMETDVKSFKRQLVKTYLMFIQVLKSADLSEEGTYTYYFKKNKVNQFRQRSNY